MIKIFHWKFSKRRGLRFVCLPSARSLANTVLLSHFTYTELYPYHPSLSVYFHYGGSVAECLGRPTWNSEDAGSNPALTTKLELLTVDPSGAVASWLARSTPERALRVRALAGNIVLCSWERCLTLTVPLSTQVYKLVPANLMLGVTLRWTSFPSMGEEKYS